MRKTIITLLLPLLLISISCSDENEPIGQPDINEDTFAQDSELRLLLEENASGQNTGATQGCIEFNYSFVLFIFDENMEYVEPISLASDQQFISLLENLEEGYSLSISFPITGNLSTGELLEIENNEELKDALTKCFQDAEIGQCDEILLQCPWTIVGVEGFPNEFEGEKLTATDIMSLYVDNSIYKGTWVSLFIEDDLHVNINLNTTGTVADFWNSNWKIITLSNSLMELEAGNKKLRLELDCLTNCDSQVFEQCEEEDSPDIAAFDLTEYSVCTFYPINSNLEPVSLHYFETEEDATNNLNEIIDGIYTNTTNPQTIYVRIEEIESEVLVGFSSFDILAVSCD